MLLASVSVIQALLHVASGASTRLPRASSGSTAPQPDYSCTNDYDWIGDGYNYEDCRAAVQRLYNVEVAQYGGREYEFLPHGGTNQTQKPTMETPRRYTVGQCTLAIVMMDFFQEGELPGEDPSGQYIYSNTEVTSFEDLWLAAGLVEMNCVVEKKMSQMLGWAPTATPVSYNFMG
ncbi:hypothetical protein ABVK25_009673 [Lepraria finkii]|uniref:Uncharacterized protein n=1 Tax=Lepraria finkii TaxID=1340010 RepID=A0ABR4B2R0_9LECA